MEENDCAPTPALQSRKPPQSVIRSTTTVVRRVGPPKPPKANLLAMAGKFQIIQAPVAHTHNYQSQNRRIPTNLL
ncbi:hypothetical protein A2U01_0037190 [Trifolium medium]|uniref:Uncharacterized protein n=1 Tax=Trifolium medium TaxID=97028 RepID=A0A392PX75_9FABA|nr:hypothetical protein [Trifolium medium]